MSSFSDRLNDLREMVDDIVNQCHAIDKSVVNGPHMELNLQELRVVEFLGDKEPRKMRDLAEVLGLAVNSVTSVIDNLEQKQIVRRNRSDSDRRVVYVELTDQGKKTYEAAVSEKKQVLKSMLKALTEDEQEIFMVLLRKIARAGRSQVQKMGQSTSL